MWYVICNKYTAFSPLKYNYLAFVVFQITLTLVLMIKI
ncbi:putative membrane protein [Clostridioides difficile DA00165]|nr:putative membrane protein [Clostridioides difficile DA00165]